MQLRKLVMGLDFNEPSYNAARWFARHFGPDLQIILLHVAHAPERPTFLEGLVPTYDELAESAAEIARSRLRDIAASMGPVHCDTVMRVGRPADQIPAVAEEAGADLIVVADRARRVPMGAGVGSTAEQLLRTAYVPVFLSRHLHDGAPRRIMVALDESPVGDRILAWARLLADRFGAEVLGFHALSRGLFGSAVREGASAVNRLEAQFEERTLAWLRDRLDAGGLSSTAARPLVAFGDPAYEIVAAARDNETDMIVMGSRGSGSISPAILGGRAATVIRAAPVPILVVTDPGARTDRDQPDPFGQSRASSDG